MNNNTILKKITIAQSIKHFECKEIFELGGIKLSSSQIKAYMAGSQNKNYLNMPDEHLEGFLNGLIIFSRGERESPDMVPRAIENYIMGLMQAGYADTLDELSSLIEDARNAIVRDCDTEDK
jgi:hypothetical protein